MSFIVKEMFTLINIKYVYTEILSHSVVNLFVGAVFVSFLSEVSGFVAH